jgi:transglutaminase-like putative cysteine protease
LKRLISISTVIALVLITAILSSGCTSGQTKASSNGDALLLQGENEFQNNNFHAAERIFRLAQENYTAAGDTAAALKTRDRVTTARMMTFDFPYNRSVMDKQIAVSFPDMPAEERAAWLDDPLTVRLSSDGEVWYFDRTQKNILNHNMTLMRKSNAKRNHTPLYDELIPLITAPQKNGAGPLGDPVAYEGREELTIPRDALPRNGMLKLWIPLPIETGSQTNVTIVSVEPAHYVKYMSGTGADIGLAYLEVPLWEVSGPSLNVTVKFRFIQHEQRPAIDPAKVRPYNTGDPLYKKYTAPGRNTVITPEMKKKALEIVGNETNPYLQAQKIYWDIITTHPYSSAPHNWLDATSTPESAYVLTTGIGDCGSQSMYFTALCRALGIPARTIGGNQMILGTAGDHFWAEFYLEGYGWVPVDVTAAEGGEWSYNASTDTRQRYREYFFGSLDPYRYIIQKDVDTPLVPATNDATSGDMALQEPKGVCDTCMVSPNLFIPDVSVWKVTFVKG